jgi:hypothetical protein
LFSDAFQANALDVAALYNAALQFRAIGETRNEIKFLTFALTAAQKRTSSIRSGVAIRSLYLPLSSLVDASTTIRTDVPVMSHIVPNQISTLDLLYLLALAHERLGEYRVAITWYKSLFSALKQWQEESDNNSSKDVRI